MVAAREQVTKQAAIDKSLERRRRLLEERG